MSSPQPSSEFTGPRLAVADADHTAATTPISVGGWPIGNQSSKLRVLVLDVLLGSLLLAALASLTPSSELSSSAVVLLAALPIALYVAGLYHVMLPRDLTSVAEQLLLAGGILGATMLAAGLTVFAQDWQLGAVLAQGIALLLAVPLWRFIFRLFVGGDRLRRPIAVVGSGPAATRLADLVRRMPNYRLVGEFGQPQHLIDTPAVAQLPELLALVSAGADARPTESRAFTQLRLAGVETVHLASLLERSEQRIPLALLNTEEARSWFEFPPAGDRAAMRLKRVIDILGAVVLLALLGLPALLGGIAMCLTSRGPMIYSQRRVGKGGKLFQIYKLRSMRADAESRTGAVWSSVNDPRITAVGSFLRKTRLDEVPQLFNVIAGSMSLVGPRPERPEFTEKLSGVIPLFDLRHGVNPGLTGWAQVRYPYGSTVQDSERKLEYDLFYVKHWSLWFDIAILLQTIRIVSLARGGR